MSAGVLNQISFGLETSWGTAVTPNKSLAVHPGDGIQTDNDVQFVSAIKAQLAKNVASFKGAVKHEGEYEFDFIPGVVGYLLKSVFGGLSSALKGGETLVYEHTYTEAEAKPSLTVEQAVGTDQIVRRYAGSIIHSLKLSCKAGEALVTTVGIKAKSSASATKITPSYETIRNFNFNDCVQASGFKIGGVAYNQAENFEVEYKNNIEMLHTLGANDPTMYYVKASDVLGKFDLYLDSATAAKYTDYLNKTEQALDIVFTGDAIGTASNYKLDINIPKVVFKAGTYPVNEEYNIISVEFEGIYDTTTSRLIRAILTNLTANYN